jgi:hypothetical protein
VSSEDGNTHETKKSSAVTEESKSPNNNNIKQADITGGNFQTITETVHPFYRVHAESPGAYELEVNSDRDDPLALNGMKSFFMEDILINQYSILLFYLLLNHFLYICRQQS